MHYLRYSWSALLLVAAILAPNPATTITLLAAGLITVLLAVLRERRLAALLAAINDGLPFQKTIGSTALERSLLQTQKRLLGIAVGAELVIFLALLSGLDITVARNYALLVLAALAPLGLELTLGVLIRSSHKRSSETVRTALGYAVEDAYTLLAITALSFVGTVALHIPAALTALQILLISCIARPLLSGQALQATPHKIDRNWRVLFASLLTYGSFVFFFIRHYLAPRYADPINSVTWQATTVALAVFIACQTTTLVFNPQAPKSAAYRGLCLLGVLSAAMYFPPLQTYFMTHGLSASDWVWTIIAGLVFMACILLRQQFGLLDSRHRRQAVIDLRD